MVLSAGKTRRTAGVGSTTMSLVGGSYLPECLTASLCPGFPALAGGPGQRCALPPCIVSRPEMAKWRSSTPKGSVTIGWPRILSICRNTRVPIATLAYRTPGKMVALQSYAPEVEDLSLPAVTIVRGLDIQGSAIFDYGLWLEDTAPSARHTYA